MRTQCIQRTYEAFERWCTLWAVTGRMRAHSSIAPGAKQAENSRRRARTLNELSVRFDLTRHLLQFLFDPCCIDACFTCRLPPIWRLYLANEAAVLGTYNQLLGEYKRLLEVWVRRGAGATGCCWVCEGVGVWVAASTATAAVCAPSTASHQR